MVLRRAAAGRLPDRRGDHPRGDRPWGEASRAGSAAGMAAGSPDRQAQMTKRPLKDDLAQGFDSIDSALEALGQGQMIVVLDDEIRENEGDLIIATDKKDYWVLVKRSTW